MTPPTPTPVIAIEFVSWALLIQQLIPCLTILAVIVGAMLVNRGAEIFRDRENEEWAIHTTQPQSVEFHFRDDALARAPTKRSLTPEIEMALKQRTNQYIKCPYCTTKNLTSAMQCQQCGGPL